MLRKFACWKEQSYEALIVDDPCFLDNFFYYLLKWKGGEVLHGKVRAFIFQEWGCWVILGIVKGCKQVLIFLITRNMPKELILPSKLHLLIFSVQTVFWVSREDVSWKIRLRKLFELSLSLNALHSMIRYLLKFLSLDSTACCLLCLKTCLLQLLVLRSSQRPNLSLFVNMIKGGSNLVEACERREHQFAILSQNAYAVVWLNLALSVNSLRLEIMRMYL